MVPVSVVVPTRNRPEALARLLSGLSQCTPPPDEVIVVDQSASDDSEGVVAAIAPSLPRLVYLRTESRGLSRARNLGLQRAVSAVVSFIDDDCIPEADWVARIGAAFGSDECLACVMGGVLPEGEAQRQFPLSVRTSQTPREYLGARDASPGELGWGGNLSIRGNVLALVGTFDETLGAGARWPAAEDTDLVYRLLRGGHKAAYRPEVVVRHAHDRDEQAYLRTRLAYRMGLVAFLVKHILQGDRWLFRFLRWQLLGLCRSLFSRGSGQSAIRGAWPYRLRSVQVAVSTVVARVAYESMKALVPCPRQCLPCVTREWVSDTRSSQRQSFALYR